MKTTIFTTIALCLLSTNVFAHSGHEEPQGMGVVSEAYLNSPIAVLKGVGTYPDSLNIQSQLPAGKNHDLAVTYTKQGIALHHAFQWEDSVRSFREALRLDPSLARAHLGIVVSYLQLAGPGDSLDFVVHHLDEAAKAAAKGTHNETDRMWVDIMALYFPMRAGTPVNIASVSQIGKLQDSKNASGNDKLSEILRALIAQNDPEAVAFAGWDLQSYPLLEQMGQQFPKHSGIWHYLTHIYENSGRYQEAAEAARKVIAVAPDAPHLLHMYGHVLPMLGDWDQANVYFLKAHCIHKAILQEVEPLCANQKFEAPLSNVAPSPRELWHYAHNLDLYGFSLMRTRQLGMAETMFNEMCKMDNCTALIQFYIGEGMYQKAIDKVDLLQPDASSPYAQMKVQALVGLNEVSDAQALFQQTMASGLEGFASQLSIAWATKTSNASMSSTLNNFLAQATTNPNFDTWSHILPVLRKLHNIAKQYGATQDQTALYNAIQKIDKGHPVN